MNERTEETSTRPEQVQICGLGVVSPAGWGLGPFWSSLSQEQPVAASTLERPGWETPLSIRKVPAPSQPPKAFRHPRLRRSSTISRYALSAAQEALESDGTSQDDQGDLGLVFCTMSGSVNYSRRFYTETLEDPATASPLLFPETVFNAPASHLASVLGALLDYTLVGDVTTFVQGLEVAHDWLVEGRVNRCLVVAAEERDWLTADAFGHFDGRFVVAEGAAAMLLSLRSGPGIALDRVTDPHAYRAFGARPGAVRAVRAELGSGGEFLCDSRQDLPRLDAAEKAAWEDWQGPCLSPRRILGEGLTAASGWSCVAAVQALQQSDATLAWTSVAGLTHQAIGAGFRKLEV